MMTDPVIIYGFALDSHNEQINRKWLNKYYPNVKMYTNFKLDSEGDIMYGINVN